MSKRKRRGVVSKMSVSDWKIFGIRLFGGGESEVLKIVDGWLKEGERNKWIATVNPEFVMRAVGQPSFKNILEKTDINVIDGVGLIWAKKVINTRRGVGRWLRGFSVGVEILQGKHREGLVTGADLMKKMSSIKASKSENLKIFFLGGWGDRAKRTATSDYFKGLQTGWSSGEPEVSNEEVKKQINKFKPDILLVAYGMQKQEEWVAKNIKDLEFGVAMGVGRSFDYYSGDLKRAPGWIRKMGLEWLYSLIVEPKRWRRQLALPRFAWKVLTD